MTRQLSHAPGGNGPKPEQAVQLMEELVKKGSASIRKYNAGCPGFPRQAFPFTSAQIAPGTKSVGVRNVVTIIEREVVLPNKEGGTPVAASPLAIYYGRL
jgi:hypothetical protein